MLKHCVLFILLSCNCAVYAGPEVYERYDFNGRGENTATVGVSPAGSENLKFVTIGTNSWMNFEKVFLTVSLCAEVYS